MKESKYKIATIGKESVISGFKALGVTPMIARDSDTALEYLKKISSGEQEYAVVIITEELLNGISEDEYKKITKSALPAIVAFPEFGGGGGRGEERLKVLAEKAIGSSIL